VPKERQYISCLSFFMSTYAGNRPISPGRKGSTSRQSRTPQSTSGWLPFHGIFYLAFSPKFRCSKMIMHFSPVI